MEDQPADPGDLTTDPAPAVDDSETKPRRRRRFSPAGGWFRRRNRAPDPIAGETAAEDVRPAPRTPVGKAAKAAKTVTAPAVTTDETPDATPDGEESEAVEGTTEVDAAEDQPVLVAHRPAGKRLKIAAVAASGLFVAAAAFAGAALQPYLADRAAVDTKLDIAETAANAITTLWTYTPDNMESLPDRASTYLGGDFATEYRRYIDAIVATNRQAQVSNTTQVMGTAVESLTPSEATALVFTNSVSTSPVNKNIPSLRYLSYRLTMERSDARWLITRMDAVTQLDLTPQL